MEKKITQRQIQNKANAYIRKSIDYEDMSQQTREHIKNAFIDGFNAAQDDDSGTRHGIGDDKKIKKIQP